MKSRPSGYPKLCLIALGLFLGVMGTIRATSGYPLTPANPTRYTAEASISLWEEGTLKVGRYETIFRELLSRSRLAPNDLFWEDIFAIGLDGSLWPLRSLSMAVVAAPFYGLAGAIGFWLFNCLAFVATSTCFYLLCRRLAGEIPSLAATVVTILGTSLIQHSYAFSYDLFMAACLLGSIVIVSNAPVLASIAFLLAVETKQYMLLFLPAVAFLSIPQSRIRFLITFALLFAALGAWQWWTWGAPFSTSYSRSCYFFRGFPHIQSPVSLSLTVFASEWYEKLFDRELGIITTNPILPLSLLGWMTVPSATLRRFSALLGSCILLTILIYSLRCASIENFSASITPVWSAAGNAPRYYLPVALLLNVGLARAFELLYHRYTNFIPSHPD